ncbi:alpha-1,2-fucosyltransferase, partial [Persicitalea sp.]|uniref:alpha-1,2-fucosyltransferase n=1 Tax=Persicitalea sp. TaxID=3100273 RepID=UPI0035932EDE
MIIVKLQGGLGNQLFQYATARALAHHHNTVVAFDARTLRANDSQSAFTPRRYELDQAGIVFRQVPMRDRITYGMESVAAHHPVARLLRRLRGAVMYSERSPAYDPALCDITTSRSYIKGFFQSEKYFHSIRSVLLQEINFPIPTGPYSQLMAAAPSISLHVRRGDYVTNHAARTFHGLCSSHYYRRAMEYAKAKLGTAQVFVFSDDLAWAKENLVGPLPITFVEHTKPVVASYDLCLMSRCHHHIIANSSFSWWGAWLNPSPDKLVIAPDRWFADDQAQQHTKDLIPDSW